MKTIGEQAQEYREARGWSTREMADAVGTSRQNIETLEKRGDRQPRYVGELARVMGTTVDDLLQGRYKYDPEGSICLPAHTGRPKQRALQQAPVTIDQYDTGGSMGTGVVLRDQPGVIQSMTVSQEWVSKNLNNITSPANLAIVTGFGDSMRGMFNPGDPLMVDTGVKSCDFDGVFFFRVGEEGFIKRLQRIPGQGIRVISTNKEYEPWTITPDMDFEVFARVLRAWKGEDF